MTDQFNMDSDDIPKPTFDVDKETCSTQRHQSYRYISHDKLAKILSDPTYSQYDFLLILDARFNYEHKSGKIIGALNITSYASMIKVFEKYEKEIENGRSICIVIHCEYSSVRGPKLYDLFREHDRNVHISDYPKLTYPDLFLLEGGYKKFYSLHPELCVGGYVSMYDPIYISNEEIKRCQRSYFYDYKERFCKNSLYFRDKSCNDLLKNDFNNQNLKIKLKHCSLSEPCFNLERIDDDSTIESQPRTVAYTENNPHNLIQFI